MWYLIYTKMTDPYSYEVDIKYNEFPSRRDLLLYALENRIKLHANRVLIISPKGVERGSPDIIAELDDSARLAALEKETSNV